MSNLCNLFISEGNINSEDISPLEISSLDKIPLYSCSVRAGFPSPAEDYEEEQMSLKDVLNLTSSNPASVFVIRARGDSMIGAGIKDKTFLIVDRSLSPINNDIVIVSVNTEFTVKRYKKLESGKILLCAENCKYKDFELMENFENIFWGVVIGFYQRCR